MHDKFTDKELCERFSTVAYNKALEFLNEAQELIGSAAQLFIIYKIYAEMAERMKEHDPF